MPEDKTVDEGTELGEQLGTDTGAEDASADNGNPEQSNGYQPEESIEDWKNKYSEMLEQNKALNRLLVEARRQANSNRSSYKPGQVNDQGNEGQISDFGTAMKLAEADLRSELDGILDLYPELPANMVRLIRSNPWGYASRDSFMNLNVPNALLDIETWVANYVAELSSEDTGTQESKAPIKVPASKMKPNAVSEGALEDEDVIPGSQEDTNPYTMPLDKLERKVAKLVHK